MPRAVSIIPTFPIMVLMKIFKLLLLGGICLLVCYWIFACIYIFQSLRHVKSWMGKICDSNYVPNIVHYLHAGGDELDFIQVVSIRSAFLNHHPEKIILHCDHTSLKGKYWDMVKDIPGLEIKQTKNGKLNQISSNPHALVIAKLEILIEEGGIFLDNDVYVVNCLDGYRFFKTSMGWPPNCDIGTEVIIANNESVFIKMWLDFYKGYDMKRAEFDDIKKLPTMNILLKDPDLINRVPYALGVHNMENLLYSKKSDEWENYDCIHLLLNHECYLIGTDPAAEFNEMNIKRYNRTFGDMARLVLYNTTDFVDDETAVVPLI